MQRAFLPGQVATNPVTARQLAAAAWRVYPTGQAGSVMATLLTQQQQGGLLPADPFSVAGVAFSPDGKLLATADNDGTARVWHPVTGQPIGAPIQANLGYPVQGVQGDGRKASRP